MCPRIELIRRVDIVSRLMLFAIKVNKDGGVAYNMVFFGTKHYRMTFLAVSERKLVVEPVLGLSGLFGLSGLSGLFGLSGWFGLSGGSVRNGLIWPSKIAVFIKGLS